MISPSKTSQTVDQSRGWIYSCATYIKDAPMQVAKWGNSLALRLPAAVVDALQLQVGDEVVVRVADARELSVERKPDREALLSRLRSFRGRLPADFLFDREDADGR